MFNQPLPYDEAFAQQLLADPSRETLLIWSDWLEERAPQFASAVRTFAQTSYRPLYSTVVRRVYWGLRSLKSSKELPKPLRNELERQCGLSGHGKTCHVFGVKVTSFGPIGFHAEPARAYMAALLVAALVHEQFRAAEDQPNR